MPLATLKPNVHYKVAWIEFGPSHNVFSEIFMAELLELSFIETKTFEVIEFAFDTS